MTDDLDKLAALLRDDIPTPSVDAKKAAMMAGMAAFEKNAEKIQGTADAARPINNRPETERGFLEGLKAMFDKLTGRQMMLGTASFATIAIAIVVTQNLNLSPLPSPVVNLGIENNEQGYIDQSSATAGNVLPTNDVGQTVKVAPGSLAATDTPDENFASDLTPVAPPVSEVAVEEAEALSTVAPVVSQDRRERGNVTNGAIAGLVAPQDQILAAPMAPPVVAGEMMSIADAEYDDAAGFIAPTSEDGGDQFVGEPVSPLKVTLEEPVSTFSIDVDTASYSVVRRSLLSGWLPNPAAVRTEELINYFDYDYALPIADEQPFAPQATVFPTPWNDGTLLLHIGIQGYDIAPEDRPPVNLVFLIDTSGSMNAPDKLPLLIQSFRLLLGELNDHDSVAIVTYAGSAGVVLEPTPATEVRKILQSLTRLAAGGSTAGQAGLQQAYALAEEMSDDGDTSRVILATDGDFNVGISDRGKMLEYIEEKRETGVYLSILGFGQGNYNDALMQTLAQNGNGTAAYIDSLAEAQKVLVDQIGGALFTIGQDVKIQIEFNPAEIAEYRLIGYETRALAREDFNNDAVDAGDIGSGHQVTAIYEITPVGSDAISVDPLRFGQPDVLPDGNGELAFLKLRYKMPGESTSNLITTPVILNVADQLPLDVVFSTAVASFGQLLRGDTRLGDWSYDDVVAMAQNARGEDPFGYRSEFIRLVRLAETAQ